jgi:hypothetical protein
LFAAPGLLNEIGPRLFRLPSDILEDEESMFDIVTFIIECLSLYRMLLLKNEDTVLSPHLFVLFGLTIDRSERSRTGETDFFCVVITVEEEYGEMEHGAKSGARGAK